MKSSSGAVRQPTTRASIVHRLSRAAGDQRQCHAPPFLAPQRPAAARHLFVQVRELWSVEQFAKARGQPSASVNMKGLSTGGTSSDRHGP